jgi:hypothetical protein
MSPGAGSPQSSLRFNSLSCFRCFGKYDGNTGVKPKVFLSSHYDASAQLLPSSHSHFTAALSLCSCLQIVAVVYEKLGLTLFALELYSTKLRRERVVLNPIGFLVPDVTKYSVMGYVIASDKEEADLLSTLNITGTGAL